MLKREKKFIIIKVEINRIKTNKIRNHLESIKYSKDGWCRVRMIKYVSGRIKMKSHIIIMIISFIIIMFMGNIIYYLVHNFYNEQMEKDSQRIAKNYAQSLEHAMTATEIINRLLHDKISAVTQMIGKYKEQLDNEELAQIARTMAIDEIYSYDTNGRIVASASGKYIGWTAYKGHPVYQFIESKELSVVEEIRKDSESNDFYQYGYYRRNDGSIVQIGIKADKIYEFLDSFDMDHLIEEMTNYQYVESAYFMDNNYHVLAGINMDDNLNPLSKEAKVSVENNTIYSQKINLNKKNLYQIMVPIEVNTRKVGTLVLWQSRSDMDKLIYQISFITYSSLIIIFVLIIVFILLSYNQNNKLIYQAYHNPITNLANKRCYDEYLPFELKKNYANKRALYVINYKNLDFINFAYGYHYSEDIIKKTAEKIALVCSDNQFLFHIADDRFAIYVNQFNNSNALYHLGCEIIKILKENAISNQIGGSVGIYEINQSENDANDILKSATLAANSKQETRFGIYFYNEETEKKLHWEEEIENELKRIIYTEPESEDFYLEFQPILDLKTNQICSFEALARLKTDKLGNVSPVHFIKIAEKNQLIVPLGEKVLRLACSFLKSMKACGFHNIKIAVNVSGIQLLNEEFIPLLLDIMDEYEVAPSNLEIELTESVFSNDFDYVNEQIAKLKSENIDISIDDFGTGYSSFARESDLDVTTLKIDKFFIDKLLDKNSKRAVTSDIIAMAHKLGHRVVAEGVEFEEQKDYLIKNQCDYIQGYIFSKPLGVEAAIELLLKMCNNNLC